MVEPRDFMRRAVELARHGAEQGVGGPFGAVIVKDGQIIAEGANCVTSSNDPTAHAEVVAIRNACRKLNTFCLAGAVVYSSCEPCPMCLAAIYWARLDKLWYAATREDAARVGFDDAHLYQQLPLPPAERALPSEHLKNDEIQGVMQAWQRDPSRVRY